MRIRSISTVVPLSKMRLAVLRGCAVALLASGILAQADVACAQTSLLHPPEGGELRALVVGIDAYQYVPRLRGAAADAQDIEETLRRNGVRDVTALIDGAATRASIMGALEQLLSRSRSGDLVILSVAGHGVQEPEHVKGSQPDGMDNVFVLAGFNPRTRAGSQERIIGTEFNHVIKQFEAKGVKIVFVADACYGGGLAREIDPRGADLTYRQAPKYTLTDDALHPISTTNDAFLTEIDFKQTAFLAAVDRRTKAPEVRIPGVPGFRGALSYAVARALDGAADEDQDGTVTQKELFNYVRQVAYQLSDQRQNVVTSGPAGRDTDPVFDRARTVVLLGPIDRGVHVIDPLPDQPSAPQESANNTPPPGKPPVATGLSTPVAPNPPPPQPVATNPIPPSTSTKIPLAAVRVAVLGDQRNLLSEVKPRTARFDVVAVNQTPDLIWDPQTHDVLAGADVIAHGIDRNDLPSVIDRVAAVNGFKQLAARALPQSVRVLPGDRVHRRDERIDVQVSDVAQRSLVLFDINGDGTVQTLYPNESDPAVIGTSEYRLPVKVAMPFGADQVIAVTSAQRLDELKMALKKYNQRRTAVEVLLLVEQLAPLDAKIGFTGLYTAQ
jgi:hypothetical protein